jgi:hypothetical protein
MVITSNANVVIGKTGNLFVDKNVTTGNRIEPAPAGTCC